MAPRHPAPAAKQPQSRRGRWPPTTSTRARRHQPQSNTLTRLCAKGHRLPRRQLLALVKLKCQHFKGNLGAPVSPCLPCSIEKGRSSAVQHLTPLALGVKLQTSALQVGGGTLLDNNG